MFISLFGFDSLHYLSPIIVSTAWADPVSQLGFMTMGTYRESLQP